MTRLGLSALTQPTEAILRACDVVDEVIGRFIASCDNSLPELGRFEAEIEAVNLFMIATRHAQGVLALARRDIMLLPPALVSTRACFESAVRAAWLVNPTDVYARDVRWLAHLAGEEVHLGRVAADLENGEDIKAALRTREGSIREFRSDVERKLPHGVETLKKAPPFKNMLADLGGSQLYTFYRLLSQYAHGEHGSTWTYRTGGLGANKVHGEFTKASDWFLPLHILFVSFSRPGYIFLKRLGGDADAFLDEQCGKRFEEVVRSIR